MDKSEVVTLRQYIDSSKPKSFLNLIRKVDLAMQKCHQEGLTIVDVNLDQICINLQNNEIVFPHNNTFDPYEKTIANYQTGISLNAERKSSAEHNETSLALMVLGWYVSSDGSSIKSDIDALENFTEYTSKTPEWITPYFEEKLKKMNTTLSFSNYYQQMFIDKINNDLDATFREVPLTLEERTKISRSIISNINNSIRDLFNKTIINGRDLLGFYEQIALNKFAEINNQYKNQLASENQNQDSTMSNDGNQIGHSQALVKILQKPGVSYAPEKEVTNSNFYEGESININQSGAGFTGVLTLVLIAGLITLVLITSLLIFTKAF